MSTKGIYLSKRTGKWVAQYWNKELKTNISIGASYETAEEAKLARAKHIASVYDGVIDDSLPKTKGLPKGIVYVPSGDKYAASVQYMHGKWKDKHHRVHIGVYSTVEEAVEARTQFILGLL